MAAEVPTTEPVRAVAGDTWRWDRAFADYAPEEGWFLSYLVRGPTDLDIAGSMVAAVAGGWEITVPAASTDLTAGHYRLYAVFSKGTDRKTFPALPLEVEPNPETAVDSFSHDEKVLAALDAVIEGRATTDQEEVRINGRMLRRIPFEELLRIQGTYRRRVGAAMGIESGPSIEVHFDAP